jgi:hypothetical protein
MPSQGCAEGCEYANGAELSQSYTQAWPTVTHGRSQNVELREANHWVSRKYTYGVNGIRCALRTSVSTSTDI